MAASLAARAILISRAADFSLKSAASQPLLIRPLLPSPLPKKRLTAVSCLISGVDGGGVSDEFVSTRKSTFRREFTVLANMLKRIEPLDNSIIAKGVSESAKDSMKQTISTMLGLLPSDQFSVTVRVSKHPLDHLIVSSIVTGYTLWNAEYRVSLMRNFDIPSDKVRGSGFAEIDRGTEVRWKESENGGCGVDEGVEGLEGMSNEELEDLSPEALNYIKKLESQLSAAEQELNARKEENLQMELIRRSNNNLLEYLRSLEPNMVAELSRPSSPEVEEIMHQLARSILQRFFKDETASNHEEDSVLSSMQNYQDSDNESCDTIGTSRDYLAKLLFWCMLLGHHLRGLENQLHLSCAVGLL